MDGHLSESFIEELFQLEDEESFYKKLGLPVPAAEESEDEISENFEDSRDEIDDIRDVIIAEGILESVLSEKNSAQDVTDEIPVSIVISFYILFFFTCDISLGYKI